MLPFGYSLHRALNGRAFYSVCGNEVERRAYLSFFSREQREYYEKTKTFWGALYRLREGARLLVGGNKELSKRVLENGR